MAGLSFEGQDTYIPSQTTATSTGYNPNAPNSGLQILSPQNGLTYQSSGTIPTQPSLGGGSTGVLGASTGGAQAGPTAEQVAAQQKADRLSKGQSSIRGIVSAIQGVYDALYGDVGAAASDSTNQLNQRYNTENKALADQFQGQFQDIGNAFSARGAYDSSYRGDKERTAQQGYENILNQQGVKQKGELADIGKFVAQSQAEIGGGKEALNQTLTQLDSIQDPDQLDALINQLTAKKTELQTRRAGTGTQNYYLNQAQQATKGAGSNLAQLRASLTNVVASQIPGGVKGSIVNNLINSAALTPQEKDALVAEFAQLSGASQEQQPLTA